MGLQRTEQTSVGRTQAGPAHRDLLLLTFSWQKDSPGKRLSNEVREQSGRPLEVGSMPWAPQVHLHTPPRAFPEETIAQGSEFSS